MGTIGIIGDTHFPFVHPGYKAFCRDTFAKFDVDDTIHIGDVVDAHALSFHPHDPNGHSAEDEAEMALDTVADWRKTFPALRVCIGNHDARQFRTARGSGIPDRYVKSYKEVWKTPTWNWQLEHTIEGVLYEHGTGSSGKDAAFNRAVAQRCSVTMGHIHSYAGVKYHSNAFSRIFGLNVGCGIDIGSYAFDYGKMFPIRPILGCGIVVDGDQGIFVPMPCGKGERYHRSRFTKKGKR
jgi:predicted phosphodiesterase